jgi:hypothetical protein
MPTVDFLRKITRKSVENRHRARAMCMRGDHFSKSFDENQIRSERDRVCVYSLIWRVMGHQQIADHQQIQQYCMAIKSVFVITFRRKTISRFSTICAENQVLNIIIGKVRNSTTQIPLRGEAPCNIPGAWHAKYQTRVVQNRYGRT